MPPLFFVHRKGPRLFERRGTPDRRTFGRRVLANVRHFHGFYFSGRDAKYLLTLVFLNSLVRETDLVYRPSKKHGQDGHLTVRIFDNENWCIGTVHWVNSGESTRIVRSEGSVARLKRTWGSTEEGERPYQVWFNEDLHKEVSNHFLSVHQAF